MKRFLFFLSFLFMFLGSCYYDNQESLYPNTGGSCDTTNVTFSKSVAGILSSNCLSCHANNVAASLGGNIKLQDYADVKARALEGRLYGSVAHLPGFSPMPKGGGKLDDCSIASIKKWIDNGSPNN